MAVKYSALPILHGMFHDLKMNYLPEEAKYSISHDGPFRGPFWYYAAATPPSSADNWNVSDIFGLHD
jgi:hypothetical protein